MSNFVTTPRQDKYSTRLSTKLTTTATEVELNTAPDFTLSGTDRLYLVINPGTSKHQIVKISAISGTTCTVDTLAEPLYEGGTGTAFEQPAGSPVIITNTWQTFSDIETAISSKVDDTGDTMSGLLQFSGTDHAGLRLISLTTAQRNALTPADGDLVFDTDDGLPYVYYGGSWNSVDTGTTTPNASTTVAGKVELATQAEADAGTSTGGTGAALVTSPDITAIAVQNSTWSYAADAEASDTYAITLSPAPSAYATGQFFMFKANTANTGAATLNVNSLGAVTIKKAQNEDLETGDIKADQLVCVGYDGTNFQMMSPSAGSSSVTSADLKFGGDGSDGALDTSGGTVDIDLGASSLVVKNYTSINVATNNLTFSNPASGGSIVVLRSQGNVTISATIDASGIGASGGAGGAELTDGTAGTASGFIMDDTDHFGGAGEGTDGITPSNPTSGGAAGPVADNTQLYPTSANKLNSMRGYTLAVGPGGGGGGGGQASGNNPAGGAGGNGGGSVLIECKGDLNFTGTITVAGDDGANGDAASGNGVGGGGGGGGAAGSIIVLYDTATATSGTLTTSGGSAGSGGAAAGTPGGAVSGAGGGGAGLITAGSAGSNGVANSTGGAGGDGGDGYGVVTENLWFV